MMYGVNTAVSAAVKKLSQHDYVTHNLTNAQTPGDKAERLIFVRKPETDPMAEDSFSHDPVVLIDHAPGMLQKSGNPLDVAIQGEGYFAIEPKDGERFTRNGSFTLNASGELVTQSGDAVMGEGGRIAISGKKPSHPWFAFFIKHPQKIVIIATSLMLGIILFLGWTTASEVKEVVTKEL